MVKNMNSNLCKNRQGTNSPDTVVNCNSRGGSMTSGSQRKQDCPDPAVSRMCLHVYPTTGGLFHMYVSDSETTECLKRSIAKRLGVSPDRISLLFRDRLLKDGSLRENQLFDGCRVTLLPNVESGLMSPQSEVTVTQALENLSDAQVNEFLSGRSPLTLAVRLGSHVMFLQLQLSTVSAGTKKAHGQVSPSGAGRGHHPYDKPKAHTLSVPRSNDVRSPRTAPMPSRCHRTLPYPPSSPQPPSIITPPPSPKSPCSVSQTTLSPYTYPVTSLHVPPSPFLTSSNDLGIDQTNTPPPSPCYVRKPVATLPIITNNNGGPDPVAMATETQTPVASLDPTTTECARGKDRQAHAHGPLLESSALAEAKRSLSMKLKKFSEKAKSEVPKDAASCPTKGAVIETMQRLSQGVYSGTFSGTLNPALQDNEGRPKKSISTIVHILNDLLGATPPPHSGHLNMKVPPRQRPPSSEYRRKSTCDDERLSEENEMIRGKVEHIQMMLDERRRKRQERRQARASPYRVSEASGAPYCMWHNQGDNMSQHLDDTKFDQKINPCEPQTDFYADMQEQDPDVTQETVLV